MQIQIQQLNYVIMAVLFYMFPLFQFDNKNHLYNAGSAFTIYFYLFTTYYLLLITKKLLT